MRDLLKHGVELLVVPALLVGVFPGTDQPLKPRVLRHHGEIHQFEPGAEQQRQRTAGNHRETRDAGQRDPVVLQLGGLFDVVDVRTSGIVLRHQTLTLTWPFPGARRKQASTWCCMS